MNADAQGRLDEAQKKYHAAASEFSGAILAWLPAAVKDTYPTAVKATAYGEYSEDGDLRLRLQQVFDADGRTLGDIEEPTEVFETLAELVDPYLDWLADINGDDYLGDQDLDLT